MLKKTSLFFVVLLVQINFLNGQSDTVNKKLLRFSSVSLIFGMNSNQQVPANQETYKKIAPQNKIINKDFSSYGYNSSGLGYSANSYFSLFFGFNRLNKKTGKYYTQRENRVGLRFLSESMLPVSYYKVSSAHHDTLISGNITYYNVSLDSNKSVNFGINRSKVFLDLGTVFESDKNHLLSVYLGYNIGLGVSLSTSVYASDYTTTALKSNGQYISYDHHSGSNENTALKNTFSGTGFVNWGLNLRLAKTKKIWSNCVLNVETRVGAVTENIGNYGPYSRFAISSHLGLKALL